MRSRCSGYRCHGDSIDAYQSWSGNTCYVHRKTYKVHTSYVSVNFLTIICYWHRTDEDTPSWSDIPHTTEQPFVRQIAIIVIIRNSLNRLPQLSSNVPEQKAR